MHTAIRIDTKSAGFTVLELMVVMVIFGLMMAVAVPTLSSMTGADLKETSRKMSSVVRWPKVFHEPFRCLPPCPPLHRHRIL